MAQDVLMRAARSWEFSCQAANTAEQALELLERNPTPILVTDLRMPGRGGLWLVREVRRRWPDMGIIVLTAGHDPDATNECLEAGAHHYFFKPIKLEEFRHVLETTWRMYREDRQKALLRQHLEQAVRKQTRRVRDTFLSAVTSLARTVEERDPYTAGHSCRVRDYCLALGQAIGLNRKELARLRLAAQLHDIGKVAVPDAILNKPGRLSAEEFAVVKLHPVTGERILAPIVRNREILAAIRGHHERLDGSGYPDGLKGEEIPLLARLIAIPDCFDAVTTSRAYRGALAIESAIQILLQGAGSHFDPMLVEAFLPLVPELLHDRDTVSDEIELNLLS
jgi:response regulator RpfG family c-di-GMP phosphodiesterase